MKQKTFIGMFVGAVLLSILINSSVFLVRGAEQVVVVRMGRIIQVVDDDTGLYFKWPAIDQLVRLERRVMSLNLNDIQVPTAAGEFITVSTVARWRIADPILFTRSVRNEAAGEALLGQILAAAVRSQAAKVTVNQVVGGGLVMARCQPTSSGCVLTDQDSGIADSTLQYGIELKDFRILGVTHPESLRTEIESRMTAERMNAVEHIHAEAEMKSAQIAADAELEGQRIIAEAEVYRHDALAKADQDVLEHMTAAYERSGDFYLFYKTIKTYESALGKNSVLMLPSQSELFQLLDQR